MSHRRSRLGRAVRLAWLGRTIGSAPNGTMASEALFYSMPHHPVSCDSSIEWLALKVAITVGCRVWLASVAFSTPPSTQSNIIMHSRIVISIKVFVFVYCDKQSPQKKVHRFAMFFKKIFHRASIRQKTMLYDERRQTILGKILLYLQWIIIGIINNLKNAWILWT